MSKASEKALKPLDILIAPEFTGEASLSDGAQALKDKLLKKSTGFTVVKDQGSRDKAFRAMEDLTLHLKQVEATRAALKKPFWDTGVSIDDCAKKYKLELNNELSRLTKLVGSYDNEQAKIAAAAEVERQREIRRLAKEAAEAAERAKQAQAAPVTQTSGKTTHGGSQALESMRLQVEAQEKEEELAAAMVPAPLEIPQEGNVGWEVEIVVTDIRALYRANAALVKLEANLPLIKQMILAGTESIPGITFTKTPITKVNPRRLIK